ncbi:MAG: Type 1 glutamine amidotransferase-like domain-containing protein, partial [Candidatus Saccharibacteria bacterium]|nr:Type 1 glutamine amidotransferase-like domain-containing protein [Candidatus Saccharibacteria bacterium]
MTGKTFLSGGGDENASKMLDEMFFAEIPQGGNILYIATGFHESKRIATASDWMQDMIRMHNRSDIQYLFADDLSDIKHLGAFSAIYIGGGDTEMLMDEFDRTGFEFVLQNYSRHGGTVYGGGGGAITLGKFIDTRRDIRRQFKTGVELIGRYSVCTGYRDEN